MHKTTAEVVYRCACNHMIAKTSSDTQHLPVQLGCTSTCCTSRGIKLRCLQAKGRALICLHSCGFGASFNCSLNALGEQLKTQFLHRR